MKWTCHDRGTWFSADGQWRIEGYTGNWHILRLDPVTGGWRRSNIGGRHKTLASAKIAVVLFLQDAAR